MLGEIAKSRDPFWVTARSKCAHYNPEREVVLACYGANDAKAVRSMGAGREPVLLYCGTVKAHAKHALTPPQAHEANRHAQLRQTV